MSFAFYDFDRFSFFYIWSRKPLIRSRSNMIRIEIIPRSMFLEGERLVVITGQPQIIQMAIGLISHVIFSLFTHWVYSVLTTGPQRLEQEN